MGNKSSFDNKFKKQSTQAERKQNVRQERNVKDALPLISFNFKDFDKNQIPPGQSFEDWQENGLLAKMMDKFSYVCQCNIIEAQQRGYVKIYKDFPERSDFHIPAFFDGDVNWAVIKDIGGQKARVAGYVNGSVFYVVFLDMDHKFYLMKNR